MEIINDNEMANMIEALLWEQEDVEVDEVRSFQDAGLLTRVEGLVIRFVNGAEFQVTIVKSK